MLDHQNRALGTQVSSMLCVSPSKRHTFWFSTLNSFCGGADMLNSMTTMRSASIGTLTDLTKWCLTCLQIALMGPQTALPSGPAAPLTQATGAQPLQPFCPPAIGRLEPASYPPAHICDSLRDCLALHNCFYEQNVRHAPYKNSVLCM